MFQKSSLSLHDQDNFTGETYSGLYRYPLTIVATGTSDIVNLDRCAVWGVHLSTAVSAHP